MVILRRDGIDLNIGKEVRYIRDTINGNSIDNTNGWVSINAYDLDRNIISLGKDVLPSGNYTIADTVGITNGDDTLNTLTFLDNGVEAKVTVDLGEIMKVRNITVIRDYTGGRIHPNAVLEISIDGHNWETVDPEDGALDLPGTFNGVDYEILKANVVYSDWEVSTDLKFNNKILTKYQDSFYKEHCFFKDELDPDTIYYGRVRSLLDPIGYTKWSTIEVFQPRDGVVPLRKDIAPNIISNPIISTNGDYKNHIPTMFEVYANGFGTNNQDTHKSTSWVITRLDGTVIWISDYDEVNLTKLVITPNVLVLGNNEIYRISAIFHSSGLDSSIKSTLTIHVNNNDRNNVIREDMNELNAEVDNTITILNMLDMTNFNLSIEEYAPSLNNSIVNENIVLPDISYILPANTLVSNTNYIITIEPIDSLGSMDKRYLLFKTK